MVCGCCCGQWSGYTGLFYILPFHLVTAKCQWMTSHNGPITGQVLRHLWGAWLSFCFPAYYQPYATRMSGTWKAEKGIAGFSIQTLYSRFICSRSCPPKSRIRVLINWKGTEKLRCPSYACYACTENTHGRVTDCDSKGSWTFCSTKYFAHPLVLVI